MGSIGNCCCETCVPCEQQASLTTWQITTPLFGYSFFGEFGELEEFTCQKKDTKCERSDGVLAGTVQVNGDWTPWTHWWACKGPCINCADLGEPIDNNCSIDLMTGQVTCPPNHPTYDGEEFAGRGAFRVSFWYSTSVQVTVFVLYVSPTRVKFSVVVRYRVGAGTTASSKTQHRTRTITRQCTTDLVVSTGAPTDPGPNNPPAPIPPCASLLGNIFLNDCPDPYFAVPDPCSTATTTTKNYNCVEVVNGACATVARTAEYIDEEINCCGSGGFCSSSGPQGVFVQYESEEFDCDEVPEDIELTTTMPHPDLTVSWSCPDLDEPSPITFVTPSTLILRVS